ncbi:ATP-binding protein [Acetobacterium wieringae]|uniref:Electron transport complex subunit RsxB n=1 Tax=Acetobacterium wieringae TaxID=52694 RepID=A0A1F2PDL9_9FIRM|nr:4Fe-4S binding protein [Acetobacterium wieringae]OFV69343.1 electron transport complex subunit RsxB [Acetobacterium wieringae]TYC87904.1 ferredoxin [Acetobacterium wieringae]
MIRKIISIDEQKCNGCGLCAEACHEGAIGMVDGVAKLLRDDYCDGLGDCLPSCPTGAITFVEREAAAYDEAAVLENMKKKEMAQNSGEKKAGGCPGTHAKTIVRESAAADDGLEPLACGCPGSSSKAIVRESATAPESTASAAPESQLRQWPVQIKLAPVNAPYFNGSHLLIAADCTAYAYADFHNRFIKNKITLIGCPKLDAVDYADKLTEIIKLNDIKSVTVVRMEVPCCGGITAAVTTALQNSGKMIPWQVLTVTTDGKVLENV